MCANSLVLHLLRNTGYFSVLVTVTNVRLQISPRSYGMSSDIWLEIGLLYLMTTLFLNFRGTSILFLMMVIPVYIVTNSVQGFPFLHIFDIASNLLTFLLITLVVIDLR